jgi:hypothetical protein
MAQQFTSVPIHGPAVLPRPSLLRDLCSPALAGQPFCYNHDRVHHPPPTRARTPSLAIAVTNIARAVGSRRLDVQQANCIFNSMRLLKMGFEYRFPMNDGIFASPIANTPPDTSLRRKQLDYCRFVLATALPTRIQRLLPPPRRQRPAIRMNNLFHH